METKTKMISQIKKFLKKISDKINAKQLARAEVLKNKNAFITNDIEIINFESEAVERYEFTPATLDKKDYSKEGMTDTEFEKWADENLSYEELNEIPLMNALYYYPSYVSFSESDRQKVAGNTTLLYDNDLEQWAIGMTGGGMDLSPHLLNTFIILEKGIPENIAFAVDSNYRAYVGEIEHRENLQILADAFKQKGKQLIARGKSLKKN